MIGIEIVEMRKSNSLFWHLITTGAIKSIPNVTMNESWKPTSFMNIGLYISIKKATNDKSEMLFASLSISFPNKTNNNIVAALIIEAPKPVIKV